MEWGIGPRDKGGSLFHVTKEIYTQRANITSSIRPHWNLSFFFKVPSRPSIPLWKRWSYVMRRALLHPFPLPSNTTFLRNVCGVCGVSRVGAIKKYSSVTNLFAFQHRAWLLRFSSLWILPADDTGPLLLYRLNMTSYYSAIMSILRSGGISTYHW